MAVTCTSTIKPIDVANRIVSISADITNNTEPTHTIIVQNADISTPAKKAAVADIIWEKYLRKREKQIALDALQSEITQLQDNLNANIEGRSV